MKKLVLFCFMLLWSVCWAEDHQHESFSCSNPYVKFSFPQGFPATIYDGQVLQVPMHMSYVHLRRAKEWSNESNGRIYVANVSGKCPAVTGDMATWHSGECDMVAVITGKGIGTTISGFLKYRVLGKRKNCDRFDKNFLTPAFTTTVVRRPLSMQVIAPQKATVGKDFQFFLSNSVTNYWESVNSRAPVYLVIDPKHTGALNNLGLYFDKNDFSFKGTPNKAGSIKFLVGAANGYSATKPLAEMTINVEYNEKNKPLFKSNVPILSATPNQKYQLNLMTLLEKVPGFNTTNQVRFKIDDNSKAKSGLALSTENNLLLEGEANPALAGDMAILTVVATSNTGGDSEPYKLRIPVAYDRSKRPSIALFELERRAGKSFSVDLSQYLNDPAQDSSLVIRVDQVEPQLEETDKDAFHIGVAAQNPKMLEGYIPENAVGKKYYITLHANTHTGGDSEKVRIPLQVSIDKSLTPRFRQNNPQLPLVFPGQPFVHDFAANRDVWPEYEDIPYEISFAEGYTPPPWLKVENNKLFSVSDVPSLEERRIKVVLVIKNIPGGVSNPITLSLTVP